MTIDEELAGPAPRPDPTSRGERLSVLDVLRGVAVLGILVVNIDDFATPQFLHDIPIGAPVDAFSGPHGRLDYLVMLAKWVFVEGRMRGLFSMLFGAGARIADIHLRRNMLLVLIGFLHGLLIWHGDILLYYGLAALLFVYPFRHLPARTLLTLGLVLSLVFCTIGIFLWDGGTDDLRLSENAAVVAAREKAGETVTQEQKDDEKKWTERLDEFRPSAEKTRKAMEEARQGYGKGVLDRLGGYFGPGSSGTILFFTFEAFAAMLLGMGLYKNGFLTGRMSGSVWRWAAVRSPCP